MRKNLGKMRIFFGIVPHKPNLVVCNISNIKASISNPHLWLLNEMEKY